MTPASNQVSYRFVFALRALTVMIVTLMALGAGVRAMNAGLACPDWPLCFGKVIPDFHPAVWFEFVHRAYAGLVALTFFGALIYAFRSKTVPSRVKWIGLLGLAFLLAQIVMGGLTVLLQVKWNIVTSHLMLATCFFLSVLWMHFETKPAVIQPRSSAPRLLGALAFVPVLVFAQIFLGGMVASTYAGSVCVDWPLCNGEWVPTWSGAIGLQIMHRMVAYALALLIGGIAMAIWRARNETWMTNQILRLAQYSALIVLLQVGVGVANLLLFIPPWVTVLHQSIAIVLLGVTMRLAFVAIRVTRASATVVDSREFPAARAQRA